MTRWWDPGSAVALLGPVEDTRVGLANAVTAMHRAGAAAILDAITTNPVLDDQTLVQAMATARAQFAPLLLEPVTKAVGDPRYAGLLLRDVFDDAELTALQLFRAAVTKGLPRRMAAERVAKVYGVPRAQLGRYARIAVDPRTPPPVITDVADETLFAAIAHLVGEETRSEIRKENVAEYNATATGQQHPKAADGTYTSVEEMLAALGPTTRPAETPAAEPMTIGPAEPRKLRRTRKTRKLRRLPADPAARPTATRERATRERATRERADRALSTRGRALRTLAAETNTPSTDLVPYDITTLPAESPAGKVKNRRTPSTADHLAEHTPPAAMVDLADDLGYALPYNEAVAFLRDAPEITRPDGVTAKVTRAGALTTFAGNPNRVHPRQADRTVAHDQAVEGIAQMMQSSPTFAGTREPAVYRLSDADMDRLSKGSSDARRAELEDLKADLVREWSDVHQVRVSVAREIGYVEMHPTYDDEEQYVLVYTPPPEVGDATHRPVINIAEFQVPTGGMQGTHDRGSGDDPHETFTIDPNQPLLVKTPRDDKGIREAFPAFWDEDLGILRTQLYLRAGDETDVKTAENSRFRKAMTPKQFEQAVDAGEIRRDPNSGEFTTIQDYLRNLGPTPVRLQEDDDTGTPAAPRKLRGTRKLRRVPAAPVEASERQRAMREHAQRARSVRERTARARAAIAARIPEPEFLPFEDYTLASDTEMTRRLGAHVLAAASPNVQPDNRAVSLTRDGADWLINRGGLHRDDAEANLMNRGAEDWHAQQIHHAPKLLEPIRIRTDADWLVLERRLAELSYDDGVEGIHLSFHTSIEDGSPVVSVRITANARALPVQNAIRWESGGPDDRDLELVYETETRGMSRETLANMVHMYRQFDRDAAGRWDMEDWIVNPRVRMWRVQRRDHHPGT